MKAEYMIGTHPINPVAAERIRQIRDLLVYGFRQKEIAQMMGVSRERIRAITYLTQQSIRQDEAILPPNTIHI